MMSVRSRFASASVAALLIGNAVISPAQACTRLVYLGAGNQVITARSMDWARAIGTNLWIFPRGAKRNGEVGPHSLQWTSRYGSVIASAYDLATSDGVNEAGLVANVLWLAESSYPQFDGSKPGLAMSLWAQYVLDSYATVKEAVDELTREPFTVVTANLPDEDRPATVHLSLSDPSGDSAIIEYIDGKQVIHHSRSYQVMTNSPIFEQQLALNAYWQQIGGTVMLPGTNRAADRFARASFYVDAIPKSENPTEALASVFGVIRNASVPYGITTPDQPNISSTRWRSVIDHKRKLYFFESALTPNVFWVDLTKIDFSDKGAVKKLDLGPGQSNTFAGEVHDQFKPSPPFKFLGLPTKE
ncbi:linear amide C-N hydrolase [Rhodopseudomonas palustris]|uniref:Linear amide C-N hydrolase n=1 Tax=Rhodopseudomonas palustris TaxID=1076 RepID=A0A418VDZ9_RHOPL|nr:linear amide C-N hydrolase [Rhodopseudomonas palustris]RJF74331.1 linear amide C-N hydrolase [Rhodopseudomonas palustris]